MFLRGFDGDVRQHLADEMRRPHAGIDLRLNTNITSVEKRTDIKEGEGVCGCMCVCVYVCVCPGV